MQADLISWKHVDIQIRRFTFFCVAARLSKMIVLLNGKACSFFKIIGIVRSTAKISSQENP